MPFSIPILDSSPSDFLNRTQVSLDFRQWFESGDPLANQTLLAELGRFCQKAPVDAIEALKSPRLQRELKRACARAVMRSTPPRQSNSLPEWIIEAFVLLCKLYIATKVVRVVAQGRLRGLIRLEQAQVAAYTNISRLLMRLRPKRRPERIRVITRDIPRTASLSQVYLGSSQPAQTDSPQQKAKRKRSNSDGDNSDGEHFTPEDIARLIYDCVRHSLNDEQDKKVCPHRAKRLKIEDQEQKPCHRRARSL